MITYKFDVLAELKKAGYNTTRLRREKLLNENAIQNLRDGKAVGVKVLNSLCALLDRQPGDILEYTKD